MFCVTSPAKVTLVSVKTNTRSDSHQRQDTGGDGDGGAGDRRWCCRGAARSRAVGDAGHGLNWEMAEGETVLVPAVVQFVELLGVELPTAKVAVRSRGSYPTRGQN